MKYKKSRGTHKWNNKKYQEYLNKLLLKYKTANKTIILVGLNKDMGHSNTFYNVYADYPLESYVTYMSHGLE